MYQSYACSLFEFILYNKWKIYKSINQICFLKSTAYCVRDSKFENLQKIKYTYILINKIVVYTSKK